MNEKEEIMSNDSGVCSPKSDITIIDEFEIVNEKTGTSLPNNDNSAVEDNTEKVDQDKELPPVQVFSLAPEDFNSK